MMPRATNVNFNSTIVRLRGNGTGGKNDFLGAFQFYDSTIKRVNQAIVVGGARFQFYDSTIKSGDPKQCKEPG